MGLGYGAQQTQGHQLQYRFFSRRKGRKVCILEISGRDYCVVVSYFLIVDDRLRITGNGCLLYTSFCHIAVHMDKEVLVALALDTALTLGKVSRPPRAVQVMQRHKAVLRCV